MSYPARAEGLVNMDSHYAASSFYHISESSYNSIGHSNILVQTLENNELDPMGIVLLPSFTQSA